MYEWLRRRRRASLERASAGFLEPGERLQGGVLGLTVSPWFFAAPIVVTLVIAMQFEFGSPIRWIIYAIGAIVGAVISRQVSRWWVVTDRRMLLSSSSLFRPRPMEVVEVLARNTPAAWANKGSLGMLEVTLRPLSGGRRLMVPKAFAPDVFAIFDALEGSSAGSDLDLPPPPAPV